METKNENVSEIVKGLILIPVYDEAVKYIYKHRKILKSPAALAEFKKLIATSDFSETLEKFLQILERCQVVGFKAGLKEGKSKFGNTGVE